MITEQQKIERRTGIGGSDAAAVLGLSPWATPVDVWLDKTGRRAPKPETPQMRYGNYFEDYVAKLYQEETGRTVQRYNKMIHDGCLLGNFDRLVVPEGEKIASYQGEIRTDTLLECKTSRREWDGEVPIQYEVQVLHYLGLDARLQKADIAVLFRDSLKFEVFHIMRDDEAIDEMRGRLREWWEAYVVADRMPPPMNEEDCRKLWARSNPGKSVYATEEVAAKVAEYAVKNAEASKVKAELESLKGDICAALGDAEILLGADGKPMVTWKSAKDSAKTDWEGLARKLGATDGQIAEWTRTVMGSRRFNIKAKAS